MIAPIGPQQEDVTAARILRKAIHVVQSQLPDNSLSRRDSDFRGWISRDHATNGRTHRKKSSVGGEACHLKCRPIGAREHALLLSNRLTGDIRQNTPQGHGIALRNGVDREMEGIGFCRRRFSQMLGDGLEILRPVIEGRSGMLSTAYQEYTTDQRSKEGANRPGQTSPAGSTETLKLPSMEDSVPSRDFTNDESASPTSRMTWPGRVRDRFGITDNGDNLNLLRLWGYFQHVVGVSSVE